MFDSLPKDASGIVDWPWSAFEPYYLNLAERSIGPADIPRFLEDWTHLSELVDETHSRYYVAVTVNTADKQAEERYHRFLDQIYPKAEEAEQRLRSKILAQETVPPGFEIPLTRMRVTAEIYREENLLLKAETKKLGTEYDKILGSQTVEWEGREITIAQLRPVFQTQDRNLREKAWRMAGLRQLQDAEAIGNLWRRFMELRLKIAANAGFGDYRSFRWKQLHRFDYTPEDCKAFHGAIEQVVVPAASRMAMRRRRDLELESLRPWDLDVDPRGRPPLKPFVDVSNLRKGVASIFHRLDPRLESYFDVMDREGLLDLENRKNKAPGGYCTDFAAAKRPFIFMNAVGIHDDVKTLLHESGHSFHTFETSRLPYYQQRQVGMEFAEVASMAMELLASSHFAADRGGFYEESDARRALAHDLERSIEFWPYMAVVDAFQHWVYENPQQSVNPSKCDEQWARLMGRFMPWIDWTGLEKEMMTRWQRQLHIHTVPFYYVEYGMALLGAVQVWANALKDPAAAIEAYLKALALGGTVSLPDLFATAGARFAFDSGTLASAVNLMESVIESSERSELSAD